MNGNFMFYNPTKIYFGENSIINLEKELANYGNNILLAYGGGSIKKNGIYDKVVEILNKCNKNIVEFNNIMPNPTYKKLLEGKKLIEDNNINLILAVGGGSVIDLAKAISVSAYQDDVWNRYWINEEEVNHSVIPVASILTMVGTGSEMNGGSVITNEETKIKSGRVFGPDCFPKFSILDPTYTFTVSKYQMVSGIFDIISHLLEQYLSGDDDNVSDYLIEGLLRSVLRNAKVALDDMTNYEARSNLMWASTVALNTLVGLGKEQDWEVHSIEHQLGAYTDCAHGIGLAIISIPYYKHIYKYGLDKFYSLAINVFNVKTDNLTKEEVAFNGILELEKFIKLCGIPTKLRDVFATEEKLELIAESSDISETAYKVMTKEEILEILKECF